MHGSNLPATRRLRSILWSCVALAAPLLAHAQASDQGVWDTYTFLTATPAHRTEHAAVYDAQLGRMLVYGGNTPAGPARTDVWSFDLTARTWTLIEPGGGPPSAARSALGVYDAQGDRMVIVTGENNTNSAQAWELNATPRWFQLPLLHPTRLLPCVVHDTARNRLLLHGGLFPGGATSEVWSLDLTSNTWSLLATAGGGPTERWAHAGVYDPVGDRMIVFSGRGGSGNPTAADVWALALGTATPTWSPVTPATPAGVGPSARGHAAVAYDPDLRRMIVHGGWNGSTRLNDTWVLELAVTPTWRQLATQGAPPPANSHRTAIYDEEYSRLVLFGGFDAPSSPGQVWVLQFGPPTPRHALNVLVAGSGVVQKLPDQSLYAAGTEVQLTAVPSLGWTFSTWSGDALGRTGNPITLTMDRDYDVTAQFTRATYPLNVSIVGSGSVIRTPHQEVYEHGHVVTLTARAAPGWIFTGWSGDVSGADTTVSVTMTGSRHAVATFADTEGPTVAMIYPNGGELLVVDSDYKVSWAATDGLGVTGVDLDLSRDDGLTWERLLDDAPNSGTLIWRVTSPGANTSATPVFSARFRVTARDSGGNEEVDASDAPFAIYDLTPEHVLTLTSAGRGRIERSPDAPRYEHGTPITLTATPDPGWAFVGWSGDTLDEASPLVVPLERNMSVVGTFRDAVPPAVDLVYPNGGQVLIPGSRYKLAWHAEDAVAVAFVTLSVSRDSGATWEAISGPIPNSGTYVWTASRPGGNDGGGPVFASLLRVAAHDSAGNVSTDQSEAPFAIHDLAPLAVDAPGADFALRSIEPNPASAVATIHYELAMPASIRISVHDLQGREVAVLAEGERGAGAHRAEWRPCGAGECLGSGVYFVRYRSPRGVTSRRVLITR